MKLKIIIKYLILFFLLYNCQLDKIKNMKSSHSKKPITKTYYKNGILESKGYLDLDSLKIGKWDYFKKTGKIDKTIEYMKIRGKQYTNQGWYYNDTKMDTLEDFGNYYKINGLDKLNLNDTAHITINYKPILSLNSNILLCVNKNISNQFDNLETLTLDTIFGVKNKFDLYMILNAKGNLKFRGFIHEYYYRKPTLDDSTTYRGRTLYFDKDYFVDD